jgi:NAD(P)H dehydrogenase (quinone)
MIYAISLGNSKLGRLTVDCLLEKGHPADGLAALVRNAGKAQELIDRGVEVRFAEYGDDNSMLWALEGVNGLYMISGMAPPEERIRQHQGIIEAAVKTRVSHVVYASFIDTAEDSPFFAWEINRNTEDFLKESGLLYTILRNGMYSEADLDYIEEYVKAGRVANNVGEGRISYISRRDLAMAAAQCLLDRTHINKTYTLTGPEAVTQAELARLISGWTGKEIPYTALSDEEYRATFTDPEWAEVIVTLYQSARRGNMEAVTGDFEKIVGRKAYTLSETYERFYKK